MIAVNINKAKTIADEKRRAARAAEFAPLDIKVTIPSESEQAEIDREAVRVKYADIQIAIDAAADVESLKLSMAQIL